MAVSEMCRLVRERGGRGGYAFRLPDFAEVMAPTTRTVYILTYFVQSETNAVSHFTFTFFQLLKWHDLLLAARNSS